jgi:DNA invertase Pin-like site-specific DNA recombinase
VDSVDITVSGDSQTIVYAAKPRRTQNQGVAPREILLPNCRQTQQVWATPMLLGYARVSKADNQDTVAQVSALKAAGCTRVYEEKASGGRWDRPELHRMLDQLREGDVVVVWKLDRLSRSLKDLLHILEKTEAAGANFRSLTEAIDTSGPAGRMMMQMLGSFAEFERAMVRERTHAGLKAAREQGRKGGRRSKLMPRQRTEILAMLAAGRAGAEIARIFRVHRATISRIAAEARSVSPKTRTATDPAATEAASVPLVAKS